MSKDPEDDLISRSDELRARALKWEGVDLGPWKRMLLAELERAGMAVQDLCCAFVGARDDARCRAVALTELIREGRVRLWVEHRLKDDGVRGVVVAMLPFDV